MKQVKSLNKIIAFLVMMIIVLGVLFSAIYVVKHIDHECTGADCPICATIDQCLNNIKQFGGAVVARICVIAVFPVVLFIRKNYINIIYINSLISQKVRMNN